jgi:PAS domain S-box-containing protein
MGWQWNIDVFKQPVSGAVAMHPFTALLLMLASAGLWLLHTTPRSIHNIAYVMAALCLGGGAVTLFQDISTHFIQLDLLLYPDVIAEEHRQLQLLSQHMSPTTSVCFMFLGVALLLTRRPGVTRRPEQIIAIGIAFFSWFSILGYLYRVPEFYQASAYLPMAPSTAVCFQFMAFALITFHADQGYARHLFLSQRGGSTGRILFSTLLFLPMVLGYLRLRLHWIGIVSTEFGVGILVTSISLAFGIIVYRVILQLNTSDFRREEFQKELLAVNKDLQFKNDEIGLLNEELTASNEELISINEQLQVATKKIQEQASTILQQKDEQLNRVLELSHDVVWSIDLTGQAPHYISRSAQHVFGKAITPEMLNDSGYWASHMHDDDRTVKAEAARQLQDTGSMECVFRLSIASGEYRWIRQRSWLVYDEKGVAIRHEGMASDVTNAREQEASLRQSEANLRALFDNTEDAFILLDKDYRILMFNTASMNIANQSFKTGVNIIELIPESRKRIFRTYLDMVARSGTVRYQLNVGEGRSMACYYVTISAVETDHQIVGYCITTSDYTAVKRSEIFLRENEERFRALLENSEDIIWLLSPEGRIKYANPGVERITGYTAQELFSITNTDLIHPQDRVLMSSFISEVTRSPEKLIRTSFRAKHKLGHWLWLEGTAINLSNLPSVNGTVMNFRDITQRKHAEDERTNLVSQLMEQNNNLRQFSFIASHNLRGPVASMLGLLNLIKPGQLDNDLTEIFGMLQRSAVNLDVVIRDLARILEMRRDELQPREWVDLREMVQTITTALQEQIEESDAEIVLNDEAINLFLTIKSYFHSILYNLISNAIKYRSGKRRLRMEITSFRTASTTGFVVRDNGSGLDLNQHGNKVFGLYQRFNLETEGKGLGLYMVRSQVNILNGIVTLDSKPDEGAIFTVSFRETTSYNPPGTERQVVQVHENGESSH